MQIEKILRDLAEKYETPDFINGDPSWFMHQVEGIPNIETTAFVASALSYGSRSQFMPKIQYLLECADYDIYKWIVSGKYNKDIPADNECFYRLYRRKDMNILLASLCKLLKEHETIGDYIKNNSSTGLEAVIALTNWFAYNESGGIIPKNTTSACKRICMFLRWMVRDNSPVDLGLWSHFIDKRSLIMPMDTHVVQEAISLELIRTKSASMTNAIKLTQRLSQIFPDDPLKGDFALFGYGVNK